MCFFFSLLNVVFFCLVIGKKCFLEYYYILMFYVNGIIIYMYLFFMLIIYLYIYIFIILFINMCIYFKLFAFLGYMFKFLKGL